MKISVITDILYIFQQIFLKKILVDLKLIKIYGNVRKTS